MTKFVLLLVPLALINLVVSSIMMMEPQTNQAQQVWQLPVQATATSCSDNSIDLNTRCDDRSAPMEPGTIVMVPLSKLQSN